MNLSFSSTQVTTTSHTSLIRTNTPVILVILAVFPYKNSTVTLVSVRRSRIQSQFVQNFPSREALLEYVNPDKRGLRRKLADREVTVDFQRSHFGPQRLRLSPHEKGPKGALKWPSRREPLQNCSLPPPSFSSDNARGPKI